MKLKVTILLVFIIHAYEGLAFGAIEYNNVNLSYGRAFIPNERQRHIFELGQEWCYYYCTEGNSVGINLRVDYLSESFWGVGLQYWSTLGMRMNNFYYGASLLRFSTIENSSWNIKPEFGLRWGTNSISDHLGLGMSFSVSYAYHISLNSNKYFKQFPHEINAKVGINIFTE